MQKDDLNVDQVYFNTGVPTKVNTSQHESTNTSQHESDKSKHESTRV